jgi:Probable taurine catabolism dioxygenase
MEKTAQSIGKIRNTLGQQGYILENGLLEDEAVGIVESLGDLIVQNKKGVGHSVKYKEAYNGFFYSQSKNKIGPHTEFPYMPVPPTFQALYCKTQTTCSGGQTYLCNVQEFLNSLSEEETQALASEKICFEANKDIKEIELTQATYPIYQTFADSFIFRFSHNLFYFGDINAKVAASKMYPFKDESIVPIIHKFLAFTEENKIEVLIPEGSLLIWKNHHLVHWRASYSDSRRELVRYLVKGIGK